MWVRGRAAAPRVPHVACCVAAWLVTVVLTDSLEAEPEETKVYHVPDEQRLYRDLMYSYESAVRPVLNSSKVIIIHFSLSLNQIVDLDERKQVLTTNVFIDQTWEDENLKWDTSAYNGIRTLRVPATDVWLPDTFIFNNADDGSTGFMQGVYVLLNNNGSVLWPVPVKLKSSCKVDILFFPFDDQLCILRFGSWIYSGQWMDYEGSLETMDFTYYMDNSEWRLVAIRFEKSTRYNPCCPDGHPDITFKLHMRRRTFYYIFNIIVPCIMLSILTLLTFWLPTTSGEKISLGLSVFLAFSMFMLLIAEEVPATSESVPLIGVYLTTVMTMTSVSVIMSVMVINLYNRGYRCQRAPVWFKTVVLGWLCTMFCMQHDIERLARSIRLEEAQELKYRCAKHGAKDGGASRRGSAVHVDPEPTSPWRSGPPPTPRPGTPPPPQPDRETPCKSTSSKLNVPYECGQNSFFTYSENCDDYSDYYPNDLPSNKGKKSAHKINEGYTLFNGAVATAEALEDEDEEEEPVWRKRDSFRENECLMKRRKESAVKSSHSPSVVPPATLHTPKSNSNNFLSPLSAAHNNINSEPKEPKSQFLAPPKEELSFSSTMGNIDALPPVPPPLEDCAKHNARLLRKEVVVEWQTMATVIDRLLFWIFLLGTIIAYIVILIIVPYTKPSYPEDFTPIHLLKNKLREEREKPY